MIILCLYGYVSQYKSIFASYIHGGTVKGLLVVVAGIVCGVPVLVNMQAGEE